MNKKQLEELINNLIKQPYENEWVEFKLNFHSEIEIGQQISALANGACIQNQAFGYLIFGIEDASHIIIGTTFSPKLHKKGNRSIRALAGSEAKS